MDKVELIRKEIERRKQELKDDGDGVVSGTADNMCYAAYVGLLAFIDSLEEKPVETLCFFPILRLIEMLEPTERAKAYCNKLADLFDAKGFPVDAKLIREKVRIMNGENVAMAVQDELNTNLTPTSLGEPGLIQKSWYLEGYHDAKFKIEPRWTIKTGEGGPKYESNPLYGKPLQDEPTKGYDPYYLQSCIDKAKKSWEGVDVDKFMDEVRGRENEPDEELREEIRRYFSCDPEITLRQRTFGEIARLFAEWQKKQDQETIELAEDHAMLAGRMKAKEEFDQKCQGCFDRDEVFWKWMKYAREEMMKEAVEGYVDFDFIDRDGRSHVIVKSYVVEDNYGIVTGGKCKCLILKDDEQEVHP